MQPGIYNIEIRHGEPFELPITYTDANDNPIGFSDARMQVRRSHGGQPLLSLTVGSGITLTGPNSLSIQQTAEQTALLRFGWAFYDLEVTLPGGVPDTILEGRVSVSREWTR